MNEETVLGVNEVKEDLVATYGPYLTRQNLAEIWETSPESLGNTMLRSKEPGVIFLRRSKIRFGRRLRYPAESVAKAMVLDDDELKRLIGDAKKGSVANEK